MINKRHISFAVIAFCSTISLAEAREKRAPNPPATAANASPSSLVILFGVGSSKINLKDNIILDRASRAYNEGRPIVMIISGSSDRTGNAQANLALSEKRATNVLHALLDRGIPADRFQVLAKGETELPIQTPPGVKERENRRVVISWH